MDAESLVVSVDMTFADYEELLNLLRCCAEVTSGYPELVELAADFRYFCELLEHNRR